MTSQIWQHNNPPALAALTDANLKLNRLQLGDGTTFLTTFSAEGDLYSDVGSFYIGGGTVTVAELHGSALLVRGFTPARTIIYLINATFTAATLTIDAPGQTFVSDGVIVGDFVSIIASNPNVYAAAIGSIEAVTETTIELSLASFGTDAIVDATAFNFGVFSAPALLILDNKDIHLSVGDNVDAAFHIGNLAGTNARTVFLTSKAGVASHRAIDIEVDTNGFSGVSALVVDFDATDFDAADDVGAILNAAVDNTGATAGKLQGIDITLADPTNTNLTVSGLTTHGGIDPIEQLLGDPANLDSGWSNDSGVFTDRTTAFNAAGTDVQIFPADNDYILIASLNKFDEINVALAVVANLSILPTFEYIEDDGDWIAFTPSDDTEGFTVAGTIRFDQDALTTWGQRTVNEVTGEAGAIDYYWIRITRTRGVLATPPTEDTIQVTVLDEKLGWDKVGNITMKVFSQADEPTTAQVTAGQMAWWTDTDDSALRLVYNQSGTVKSVLLT
ncbi:MAG: hypothetical protein ACYTEQ_11745 [Planctomycetota bacterium]|jgi:hypothetical protein